jgi:uncharacterized membrane protein
MHIIGRYSNIFIMTRLENFCDAVFALTLLILELKTPAAETIHNSDDLWHSLKDLLPSIFAFLLSFAIIATQWVNHHEAMKWVNKSTPRFIHTNIFLLLTIVMIPFTTSFLAKFGFTEAAAPAVVLYTFVILLSNVSWNLVTHTALKQKLLSKNADAEASMKRLSRNVRFAFILYLLSTVLAFWVPALISIVITLTWVYWFIFSFKYKEKY